MDEQKMLGGLVGVAVGDALGVPVEFWSRAELKAKPVTGMRGYGSHNQPPGTWSDDSSLTLCLAESLCHGFDLQDIGNRFVRWFDEGYWTPYGVAFDIGNTTYRAIARLRTGVEPTQAGGRGEYDNGNGSLMRTLPIALYFAKADTAELLDAAHRVSCLTHAHPRSQMACGFYSLIAVRLLRGDTPLEAYYGAVEDAVEAYSVPPFSQELAHFGRLFTRRIHEEAEDAIRSSGYVIHTLEASLWTFLRASSFEESVLTAVNLGGDTDTTGAVTGGLAGVYYGLDGIPRDWVNSLARVADILDLGKRLCAQISRE